MEVPASLAGRRIRPADYLSMEVAGLSPAAVSSVLDNFFCSCQQAPWTVSTELPLPLHLARRRLAARDEAPPRSASAAAGRGSCGGGTLVSR